MEEERLVSDGSVSTIFTCPAPNRRAHYHATVKVKSNRNHFIDLTSGAGIEWTKR